MKTLHRYTFLLSMPFVLAPLIAGCASTKSRAMYDWVPDTSVSYEFVQNQDQSIEIPGQGVQEQNSESNIELTITATAPRQFTYRFTDASSTGTQLAIDPLVGLEGSVTLDERGVPVSATGLEDNAFVIGSGGADIFMSNMFQTLFLYLPESELTAGMGWTRESSVEFSQGGLNLERKSVDAFTFVKESTLDGLPVLEISQSSDVSLGGAGNQGGQDLVITMSGAMTGTLYVDPTGGHVLSSEMTGKMDGLIETQGAALPMSLAIGTSLKAVN